MNGLDGCLVLMPYVDIRAPSLALGLVQALMKRAGFSARTVYACLDFAEITGLAMQYQIMKGGRWLLGDWSFARAAFPDSGLDDKGYLEFIYERWVRRYPSRARRVGPEKLRGRLLGLRSQADRFIDSLAPRILETEPRVVACSSTFQQQVPSLALLRRIKHLSPETITLLGGANCEGSMGLAAHRNFPWVDYVVSGEAEEVIVPLMGLIRDHGAEAPAPELPWGIFGPAHRREGYPQDRNGCGAPRTSARSLDDSPPPDYSDYFADLERRPRLARALEVSLPFESSRGCWWADRPQGGCTFCGLNGQAGFRRKKAERSLEELRQMLLAYPVSRVRMCDNVIDPSYYKTFLPWLAQAPWRDSLSLFYEVRPDLTTAQAQALRQAGVIWVQPGIESLHSGCLELMNKGTRAWQHIQTLKACLLHGLGTSWHILHSFPGERDEWYGEMARLMPLLHHLEPPKMFMRFNYDRFSLYQRHPERFGLDLKPMADYFYVYPLPSGEVEELAYFFDNRPDEEFNLNPLAPFFGFGRGLEAAERACLAWKNAFDSPEQRPMLVMHPTAGGLLIRDSREVAVKSSMFLREADLAVYQACQQAPREADLLKDLAAQGYGETRVRASLERLLAWKIALRMDGRVLALATEEPRQPLPTIWDHPGGHLLAHKFDPQPEAGAPPPPGMDK